VSDEVWEPPVYSMSSSSRTPLEQRIRELEAERDAALARVRELDGRLAAAVDEVMAQRERAAGFAAQAARLREVLLWVAPAVTVLARAPEVAPDIRSVLERGEAMVLDVLIATEGKP
jgi:hypothetical protein